MKTLKVIKIGGNVINNEHLLDVFLLNFSELNSPKILVHGGGKLATDLANRMGVAVKMTNGRRITDAETLEIITMVYAGKINKNVVAKLQEHRCNAIGFTGADGNSIVSVKRPVKDIDFGFVGDVEQVNTDILEVLINKSITPVFCAMTHDENGQLLNTNADTIAAELAIGLANNFNTELYYCFEKNGVLTDISNESSVIEHIDSAVYKSLVKNKVIAEGMLPKMTNCFHALNHKVNKVCIGKPEMLFKEKSLFTTMRL